ncbi:MAG TPA: hypothetical protein PLJ47_07690 [Candidatus Hydrogenedentes bacterium]|nr:hypothetical protein [Candidatus Hydrogenedentota bacterium]HRK34463.1 hypothetical protein [Candidatus Hydrogenedentota bacterium]
MAERSRSKFAVLTHEAKRERGKEDFWYFLTEILKNPVVYEPYHRKRAQSLMKWSKLKKLFLLPRGHIKSNIITIAFAVWLIVKNPNIRILIASHATDDAQGFCRGIRQLIDSEEFQAVYPEIRPAVSNGRLTCWRDDAILVERKSKQKERTVETASVNTPRTGRHYNVILFDDLINAKSVRNPQTILEGITFYKTTRPLLDPGGRIIVTGTRYNHGDVYGYIIKNESHDFDIDVSDCVMEGIYSADNPYGLKLEELRQGKGTPVYPTRFYMGPDHIGDPDNDTDGKFSIPKLIEELGSFHFCAQYRNDPVDPSTQTFKLGDEHFVPSLPANRQFEYFRVCDLSTDAKTVSHTAIVTGAIDHLGCIYIIDIFRKQCDPSEIIAELFRGQKVPEGVRPKRVGAEQRNIERLVKHFADIETRQTGVVIPWKWLPMDQAQKSKPDRVRGLQSWVESGKFFILENCRNKQVLVDELTFFPHYGDMDVADAAAQIPHIMWTSDAPREEKTESPEEALRKWFEASVNMPFTEEEDAMEEEFFVGAHSVMDAGLAARVSMVEYGRRAA